MTAAPPSAPLLDIDTVALDRRRAQFQAVGSQSATQQRKRKTATDFDSFVLARSAGARGWAAATPGDVLDFACWLDTSGRGNTPVHDVKCSSVGVPSLADCSVSTDCAMRYACETMRANVLGQLGMAFREQLHRLDDWNDATAAGNPVRAPIVKAYVKFVAAEQKLAGVPVKQASPLLRSDLSRLLNRMRTFMDLCQDPVQRVCIMRDMALFAVAFRTLRRGDGVCRILGSQVLRLPDDAGMVFHFQRQNPTCRGGAGPCSRE